MVPKLTALLIEDNQGDILLIQDMFKLINHVQYQLIWFSRLEEGLDHLRKNKVDVVLLDLMLPDETGIDSLIRIHSSHPKTPVLVLTGLNNEETAIKALNLGAQDYLIKGQFFAFTLDRSIRYAIERNNALLNLSQQQNFTIKSQDNCKNFFYQLSSGFIQLDAFRKIVDVNSSAEKLLGKPKMILVGETFDLPFVEGLESKVELKRGNVSKIIELEAVKIIESGEKFYYILMRDVTIQENSRQYYLSICQLLQLEESNKENYLHQIYGKFKEDNSYSDKEKEAIDQLKTLSKKLKLLTDEINIDRKDG